MERLNLHLAFALGKRGEVSVSGPRGCAAHLPPTWSVTEAPAKPLTAFLARTLLGAIRQALRRRPTIVLAGSGLTAPVAWLCARLSGARYLVYLHGLDLVVDSVPYRMFWLPFIRRADMALANSHNTGRLAQQSGVRRVGILHPGTELPEADPVAARRFRERHGFGDRPLLLSVGRLTPRKGLTEFVRHSLKRVIQAHPDAVLAIIGGDATDAVGASRGSELETIRKTVEEAGLVDSVRFLPHCDDQTLLAAYQAADVYVFPVREVPGDVEGFGMVAVEAAANGLFTVAFRVGGVADAIVEGVTGALVEPGDYVGFAAAIERRLMSGREEDDRRMVRLAAGRFGWDRFEQRLYELLSEDVGNE